MTATIIELGLTLSGDVASFEAKRTELAASLRDVLFCHVPACHLELRVVAASVNVIVVMTFPETPAQNGSTTSASVAAAANSLTSQSPAAVSLASGRSVLVAEVRGSQYSAVRVAPQPARPVASAVDASAMNP